MPLGGGDQRLPGCPGHVRGVPRQVQLFSLLKVLSSYRTVEPACMPGSAWLFQSTAPTAPGPRSGNCDAVAADLAGGGVNVVRPQWYRGTTAMPKCPPWSQGRGPFRT